MAIITKPFLKWVGGKQKLLPQLLPHFPKEYNRYIEPFLGGGAVFFALDFDGECILNDLNSELIRAYASIRRAPHLVAEALDMWEKCYSEGFYYSLRGTALSEDVPSALSARLIYLNKTCFNGLYRVNKQGMFNVPFGKRKTCPQLYEKHENGPFWPQSTKLQQATLWNLSFEKVLESAGEGDFVYCDPPYEPVSKTSKFNRYQAGGFLQGQQILLRWMCLKAAARGAKVLISNSDAPFIRELYATEPIIEIEAPRSVNSDGAKRGKVKELLIKMGDF
jgi:DNA adenine methylase